MMKPEITDEMAGKALAAFDMTFGGRCDDAHLRMWTMKMRAALEAVAPALYAQGFRAAKEAAADLVETHAYTASNREPYRALVPSKAAKNDQHHLTIAAAIRNIKEPGDGA